ncbi:MAG: sigma-70 family RNA polymerase sigma factor [Bacteroidales bacterium]|nr:sigma-70 family RNA polymerase sigma factor [Bacteroidales bacterium]
MAENSNKFIAQSIKDGNEKVFAAFMAAEFNNILHFINHFVKHTAIANDLAQETFISLWFSRETINPDQNLRSYIFRIAKNKSLNQLREKYICCTDSLEKKYLNLSINSLMSEQVDAGIMALELEELIERTYSQLPETYRESFILSRKMGMTYEEIARSKNLDVKTIEYHISKSLKFFRKRLSGYFKIF